jgi:hypothetical protein
MTVSAFWSLTGYGEEELIRAGEFLVYRTPPSSGCPSTSWESCPRGPCRD